MIARLVFTTLETYIFVNSSAQFRVTSPLEIKEDYEKVIFHVFIKSRLKLAVMNFFENLFIFDSDEAMKIN